MKSRAQVAGHPIHPMLVVFPIGFFLGSWIFDLIGLASQNSLLWAAAWYCAIAGIFGAAGAAIAGTIDYVSVVPPQSSAKRRGLIHGSLNTLVLIAFIFIAIHRSASTAEPDKLEILLSTASAIVLGISGWMGGTLSYRNQIGVDRRYANAGKLRERTLESWSRPACNEGELNEGQMMLIHVDGQRIAVGRCAQGIVAFSDHCTHKGGPLSDGALIGCTVQCPWHGSQFDVHTGRVVAGPAGSQIGVYEIEIRAGEVYLKPKQEQQEAA
jgi:uncharacterized membrane protein/nitrite reductase/ring-hydroxylating ferredoxin subunit